MRAREEHEGATLATGEFLRVRERVMTSPIDSIDWETAVSTIMKWAEARHSRNVCICNVHSVVTARFDAALGDAISRADIATPDGMPLAWLISFRRRMKQPRINGPDLTWRLCEAAARQGVSVGFYGSAEETLRLLESRLLKDIPGLKIGFRVSPPFRPVSADEDAEAVMLMNESAVGIMFIGLGCPKQELWMAEHRGRLNCVAIGVGAAFDYIAGTIRRPPKWMQQSGLEWLGRLIAEPGRLWRRYFVTNSIFTLYILSEVVRAGLFPRKARRTQVGAGKPNRHE